MTEDMPGWDCATMGNLVCGTAVALPDTALPGEPESEGFGVGLPAIVLVLAMALMSVKGKTR